MGNTTVLMPLNHSISGRGDLYRIKLSNSLSCSYAGTVATYPIHQITLANLMRESTNSINWESVFLMAMKML